MVFASAGDKVYYSLFQSIRKHLRVSLLESQNFIQPSLLHAHVYIVSSGNAAKLHRTTSANSASVIVNGHRNNQTLSLKEHTS